MPVTNALICCDIDNLIISYIVSSLNTEDILLDGAWTESPVSASHVTV